VIAAAPLADVVEEAGDVEQLDLRQTLGDAAGDRETLLVLRAQEAAHVLDHLQRVGVDRVAVEEIVLHLSDDATEGGQVAAEDPVARHAAQLPGHAAIGTQYVQEQALVFRVGAERVIVI
jgi:hypothetical protein